jgi:protein ImuB
MPKALSLFLPYLLIDLTRRKLRQAETGSPAPKRDDRPAACEAAHILIVESVASRQTVVACCPRCAHAGVHPGMTLAHAQALASASTLHIERHRPERAAKALKHLATWLATLVPVVAIDPPDGLLMDIAGCERLFGTDERHARRIGRTVWKLGLRCRIAVTPTYASAWGLARFGPRPLTMQTANIVEALAPLPAAALRLEPATLAGLHEIGIETVGEVMKLPRVSLASRFGAELAVRLDQALGHAMEVIEPVRPTPPLLVERVLDGGTTRLETLHLVCDELLEHLAGQLRTRGSGVRHLLVQCTRMGSPPVTFTITLSKPSRSVKHLRTLVGRKLDTINMGFGVEAVSLLAARTGRITQAQRAAWKTSTGAGVETSFAELIDTLSDRLGPSSVRWLLPVGTHIPERAFQSVPALEAAPKQAAQACELPRERPTLMLSPPEPATAISLVPDGPPTRLIWRQSEWNVVASAGPERLAPEWWWSGQSTRDYYRIQLEGGLWLWVFREEAATGWNVHGIWA